MPEDEVTVCAAGESAWHAAAYAGLGLEWREDDGFAWGPDGPAHRFLLSAVTLTPEAPPVAGFRQSGRGIVRDSWAVYGENDLPGWDPSPTDPWMFRDPGPCEAPGVEGVVVRPTNDELLFERTSFIGAGGSPPENPGELHPTGSGKFDGLHLLLAWRGDIPIGSALAIQHSLGTVISGVSVVDEERRKGIGTLITATAVSVDPTKPATLTASDLGIGIYRGLGFRELGRPVHWASQSNPAL